MAISTTTFHRPATGLLRAALLIGVLTLSLLGVPGLGTADAASVHVITIASAIGPVTDMVIENAIARAEESGAEALIIELDTPGGLVTTTKKIAQSILNAGVPVVVYVAPSGASATSAGVFILMSGHFAVMAPGTNAGAAHPVMLQGQMDSTMAGKAESDAAAHIRALARRRDRNADWAERAVRESVSITSDEAVDSNVVDFIAKDLEALIDSLDGRTTTLPRGEVTLSTRDADIVRIEMNWRERFLTVLTNPNIAYILMSIGWLGLLMELYNPGAIFPGVVGVICLILGFYSLQTLPIDYAGLALIGAAVIMFILELKIASHGLLSIGGAIALLMGSLMLIDSPDPAMRVSLSVILSVVGTTFAFVLLALALVVKARRARPTTGEEGMIGLIGTARESFDLAGMVYVAGEYWRAEADGPVRAGDRVEVMGKQGMTLKVKRVS